MEGGGRETKLRASFAPQLILLSAALLFGAPLLLGRVLAGHDARTYLMYAPELAANAREGILLPSFAWELNGGYGGPGLLFYPPLVHALHAVALLAGLRAGVAIGLLSIVGLLLSGLAFFTWRRGEGDAEPAALAGAFVYMAAPYRMVDLYERTALSEHWAFLFPPLVLLALGASAPRPRRVALAALALAGLALTNLPMLALFGVALAGVTAATSLRRVGELALAGIPAAGLAAFALVPAALARRWTVTELFYGAGAGGFRPSENTLFSAHGPQPGFNLRVSAVVLATFLFAVLAFVLGERGRPARVWGAVAAVAFFGTLPFAGALWDAAPLLSKLQFPWRLGAPLTLGLAVLAAGVRGPWLAVVLPVLAGLGGAPLVGALSVPRSALATASPAPRVPAAAGTRFPDPVAVQAAEGFSTAPWLANPLLGDVWYLPRTLGAPLAQEIWRGGPPAVPALETAPAAGLRGPIVVRVLRFTRRLREVEVDSPAAGPAVLHVIAFPGLEVSLDGAPARAGRDVRTGLVALPLPAGRHRIAWRWRPFGPLRTARSVSAAAALLTLALLLAPRRATPRR